MARNERKSNLQQRILTKANKQIRIEVKKPQKDTNLISVLANIEIEELAIEGQVQNAFNLKVDSLEISKNSKNKKSN